MNYAAFRNAMNELSSLILTLEGNGNKVGVEKLSKEKGVIKPDLQADLMKLKQKDIPVDVVFEQGVNVLGFNKMPANLKVSHLVSFAEIIAFIQKCYVSFCGLRTSGTKISLDLFILFTL